MTAPNSIVMTPMRKLEIVVDESTDPPTLHVSLPYPDKERSLWVLRQALKIVAGRPAPVRKRGAV
jgi:hypothetical protein